MADFDDVHVLSNFTPSYYNYNYYNYDYDAGCYTEDCIMDRERMKRLPILIPLTVILALLSGIGTIGNILVITVFSKSGSKLMSTYLILLLAIIDLIASTLVIPGVIVNEWWYKFNSDVLCKTWELLRNFAIISSAMVLAAIAFDRYFLICWTTRKLTSTKVKVAIIVAIILMAGGLSVPPMLGVSVFVLYDDGTVENLGLCSPAELSISPEQLDIYWNFITALFGVQILIIIILYAMIFATVYRQNKRWARVPYGRRVYPATSRQTSILVPNSSSSKQKLIGTIEEDKNNQSGSQVSDLKTEQLSDSIGSKDCAARGTQTVEDNTIRSEDCAERRHQKSEDIASRAKDSTTRTQQMETERKEKVGMTLTQQTHKYIEVQSASLSVNTIMTESRRHTDNTCKDNRKTSSTTNQAFAKDTVTHFNQSKAKQISSTLNLGETDIHVTSMAQHTVTDREDCIMQGTALESEEWAKADKGEQGIITDMKVNSERVNITTCTKENAEGPSSVKSAITIDEISNSSIMTDVRIFNKNERENDIISNNDPEPENNSRNEAIRSESKDQTGSTVMTYDITCQSEGSNKSKGGKQMNSSSDITINPFTFPSVRKYCTENEAFSEKEVSARYTSKNLILFVKTQSKSPNHKVQSNKAARRDSIRSEILLPVPTVRLNTPSLRDFNPKENASIKTVRSGSTEDQNTLTNTHVYPGTTCKTLDSKAEGKAKTVNTDTCISQPIIQENYASLRTNKAESTSGKNSESPQVKSKNAESKPSNEKNLKFVAISKENLELVHKNLKTSRGESKDCCTNVNLKTVDSKSSTQQSSKCVSTSQENLELANANFKPQRNQSVSGKNFQSLTVMPKTANSTSSTQPNSTSALFRATSVPATNSWQPGAKPLAPNQRRTHIKTTQILFIITVVYLLAFLPMFLITHEVIPMKTIVFYLYFINNAANCIIYSFLNVAFRNEVKKLCKCKQRTQQRR